MIILRYIALIIVGLCAGAMVAGAFVAFISMIGVFTKLSVKSKTVKEFMLYENMIVLGITVGNVISLYEIPIPVGYIGLAIVGLFGGIFVGCLAGALAEVLNILPIISRRTRIRKGLPYVVIAIALGKGFATFVQYFVFK